MKTPQLLMFIALFSLVGSSIAAEPRKQCPQIQESIINDGYQGVLAHEEWIEGAVHVDEEALAKTVQQWTSNPCVFLDGRERLQTLSTGFARVFFRLKTEDKWTSTQKRVEFIRGKYPNEAFSALLEARYWLDYAWYARGSGLASSVTPEGWKLFRERLERAEQILSDSKPYASVLPNWYALMIRVLSALGKGTERNETFIEGASRFKTYPDIFSEMMLYNLPQWGGSWEAVDLVARWPLEKLKSSEGYQVYARAYWNIGTSQLWQDQVLFRDTKADWPMIKRGFDQLTKQYSSSKWLLNGYACMACMANDAETYRDIREKIGEDLQIRAWEYTYTPENCDSRYNLAKKEQPKQ